MSVSVSSRRRVAIPVLAIAVVVVVDQRASGEYPEMGDSWMLTECLAVTRPSPSRRVKITRRSNEPADVEDDEDGRVEDKTNGIYTPPWSMNAALSHVFHFHFSWK